MPALVRDLSELLAPMPVETFVRDYWEHSPVYIQGTTDKLRGMFDIERYYRLISEPRLGYGNRRVYLKAGQRDSAGEHREFPITADQAPFVLKAGITIQAEWLQSLDPHLLALQQAVRRELGIAAEMDTGCFVSPDKAGYGLHFDATGMWIMQIEGSKRWWYSPAPAIEFPQGNWVPKVAEYSQGIHGFREADLVEQILSPGDVLYFPPGIWHRAQAIGQSTHLCLTVRPSSPLDLIAEVVRGQLLERAAWRHLPSAVDIKAPDQVRSTIERSFADRLAELKDALTRLTPEALHDAWRAHVTSAADGFEPVPPSELVRPTDWLSVCRQPPVRFAIQPTGDEETLLILQGGAVIASLPGHARTFIEHMLRAGRFSAQSTLGWNTSYEWSDVEAVLRELRDVGCLEKG